MRIIGGHFKGRPLEGPQDPKTRPTSDRTREALFNILENGFYLDFKALSILDVFAGTGALGIEALSRGASFCLFIENHKAALKVLEKNTSPFENKEIINSNALGLKENLLSPFDLVFLDPPYNKNLIFPTLEHLHQKNYLKEGSIVVCETSKKENLKLPSFLSLEKEKVYGDTKLFFCICSL